MMVGGDYGRCRHYNSYLKRQARRRGRKVVGLRLAFCACAITMTSSRDNVRQRYERHEHERKSNTDYAERPRCSERRARALHLIDHRGARHITHQRCCLSLPLQPRLPQGTFLPYRHMRFHWYTVVNRSRPITTTLCRSYCYHRLAPWRRGVRAARPGANQSQIFALTVFTFDRVRPRFTTAAQSYAGFRGMCLYCWK